MQTPETNQRRDFSKMLLPKVTKSPVLITGQLIALMLKCVADDLYGLVTICVGVGREEGRRCLCDPCGVCEGLSLLCGFFA